MLTKINPGHPYAEQDLGALTTVTARMLALCCRVRDGKYDLYVREPIIVIQVSNAYAAPLCAMISLIRRPTSGCGVCPYPEQKAHVNIQGSRK